MTAIDTTRTAHRVCPLCEATCGLTLTIDDSRITGVRGDAEHVFSKGFLCPKGASLGALVHDPDRLRRPLLRQEDGSFREVGWDEAFAAVEAGLRGVVERHGREGVAVFLGNPNAHTMAGGVSVGPFVKSLGTRQVYSAGTVDQMPKHVTCAHLYGLPSLIPVPDLDRTDFLLILGANPAESNGSLCTAPDFPGRLRAIRARGGTVVVVDPRRTRTAALADTHLFVRPGTDAFLLFGILHTLFAEELAAPGRLAEHVLGWDELRELALDPQFAPEAVTGICHVPAESIRELARALAAAPTAAVYGRMGASTVAFGTLTNWLIDVLNIATGNLDSPGGTMFPLAAHAPADRGAGGRGFAFGRWTSRVRGYGEVLGELPAATLVDEITTPGPGQVRALVTIAGNPALSTPDAARLDRALGTLEFVVGIDPYLNETTRHADVILPPADLSQVGHYDFALSGLSVRNVATYSAPALPADEGGMDETDILMRLTMIASGQGSDADVEVGHAVALDAALRKAVTDQHSPVVGRDVDELRGLVEGDRPAERLLDVALRVGAYGDAFGAKPGGLSLAVLQGSPHGVDLGPLQPRLPGLLRTRSGKVELCPEPIVGEVARLRAGAAAYEDGLVLIGRRHLRSNNSWMHNVAPLVKGRDRCTLLMHPDDARRHGVEDGKPARISSRVGTVDVAVQVSDEMMPGVVSLPHGWGHGADGTRLGVANAHPGVNTNVLTDGQVLDPLSGNAVLFGVPVTVGPT